MYRGIGTVEEDLKLCAMERTNQANMYATCKEKTVPLLAVGILAAAVAGYFVGKKL